MATFLPTYARDSTDGAEVRLSPSVKPTILVIEDDDETRLMLRILLEMRGLRVVEAADGQAGLSAAAEINPDVILMDLSLPILDGLAATRLIRERETLRHVPVIITSGHACPRIQEAALTAGCSHYLVKPFDFDRLESLLLECLSSNSASARVTFTSPPKRTML